MAFFEILKNGSLVNKDESGQILENHIINRPEKFGVR